MNGVPKYPAELRERAIRMMREHRDDYGSEWAAIQSVAGKLGIAAPETLRKWIRRAEVDGGQRLPAGRTQWTPCCPMDGPGLGGGPKGSQVRVLLGVPED